MARTKRAQRAAKVAKKAKKGSAEQKAAHAVIRAEKAAQDLAKTKGLAGLRKARDAAMEARAKRFVGRDTTGKIKPTAKTQSLADTISAANQARAYADAMRRITEREKGVGTPYTGGGLLFDEGGGLDEPTFQAFRDARFMGDTTPGQRANIQEMLKQPGATVRDRRATWREEVWGDEWNERTGMWEKGDRTKVLELQKKWQKNPPTLAELFAGKYKDTAAIDVAAKAGLSGIIRETPYRRAAPLDWSAIMPTDTPLASQQALVAGKGKLYQPWATRQATPRGLINYQVPGGAGFDVTYSGANPSLFDFNQQQNNQQLNNQTWSYYDPKTQQTTTNFADWQQAQYDAMYPGRQAAAMAAGFGGLNYWKEGAEDWRASLPGGATGAAWRLQYGDLADQTAGKTATEQLIDQGLITAKGKT